ncbi:MAG: argininosuccinate lyase [archaeon]
MSKLFHGGRLASQRRDVVRFTASIKDDIRLFDSTIRINQAHVVMMSEQGIIQENVASRLLRALSKTKVSKTDSIAEDIHMLIEEQITKFAGADVGGNLHIGKSRNDQVVAAIRMTLRDELISLVSTLIGMQESLLKTADQHTLTIIPGYTHTQPAQPITFAHYLISFFDAFDRDIRRMKETYVRVNKSPMGAAALATTSFPINRMRMAELLGFQGLLENSLDAVSSRDFILETQMHLSLLASNLSRLTEDLILWSSVNFDTIELPDSFASTSSIMPQKKNPDVLEVIRARTSDVLGNLAATLTTLKGLPSGYNMDFQEITPKLWGSIKRMLESLNMLKAMLPLLIVKDTSDKLLKGYVTSTEIANVLTRKYGIPFRRAHKAVGLLVHHMIERHLTFSDSIVSLLESILTKETGKSLKITESDVISAVDPTDFVVSHNVKGGPAPREVRRMLKDRNRQLTILKNTVESERGYLELHRHNLGKAIESIIRSRS